jgi:hypothetical protein
MAAPSSFGRIKYKDLGSTQATVHSNSNGSGYTRQLKGARFSNRTANTIRLTVWFSDGTTDHEIVSGFAIPPNDLFMLYEAEMDVLEDGDSVKAKVTADDGSSITNACDVWGGYMEWRL